MNKQRRTAIAKIIANIEDLKETLDAIVGDIDNALGEERDYYDSLPDGIRASDGGEAAEEAANNLDYAFDQMSVMIDDAERAISYLEAAAE